MKNKNLKLSIISILAICTIGLVGCTSNKKEVEEFYNVSNEKRWEYITDDKTLTTTIERDDKIYEYVIEPGDYGNTYCKNTLTESNYSSEYYMKDGYIMIYSVDKQGNGYAERTHSLPTDYVWAEKIPRDLADAIDAAKDGDKKAKLEIKKTSNGYTLSFNSIYSSDYESAEVKLDQSYNFVSATIKVSDERTINLPVLKYSDEKVSFPDAVDKAVDQLKKAE